MKRARPKNKKAELKKLKIEAEQARMPEKAFNNDIENEDIVEEVIQQKDKVKQPAKKKAGRILFTIFAVLFVLLFVIMGFGLFDDSNILAPVENGKINVLLLGVDESGLRSDTIMVAAYDVNEAKVNLMSIPRDTKIKIENRGITRKINEVHALNSKKKNGEIVGAEAMAEVVTQLTGIPINYYAEFSFASIDNLFDVLGPVEFNVPDIEGGGRGMNYDDPYQNLHIHLKPGLQKLSGNQIQQFLRYRKSNYGVGTGSDTDRVARQQELFKAIIDQKVNISILPKVPAIFSQISKEIKTNIQTGDITKYIRHIAKLSGESVTTYTLPGENKTLSGGSYFVVNLEETATMLRDVFGYEGTPTDKVTVSDTHSQKVLMAGNMNKKPDKNQPATETPTPTEEPEVTESPEPTKEPEKTPETTSEPTNTPAPTKKPTTTKTPLEDLDDDVITLD